MPEKPDGLSIYARCFDETSPEWKNNPELNRVYLLTQMRYMNFLLQRDGFVFLNEVYVALGFPRTISGQLVGWMHEGDGDGYIDFGIDEPRNKTAFDEVEACIWLDFNVDGVMYDKIEGALMGEEVTETTETTTTETKAPEPSTAAQEVVEEVHQKVEETAPVVEETTVTRTETVEGD